MKPRYWIIAGIALAALTAWLGYGCEQRRQGVIRDQIKTLEHERDSLKTEREQREVIYRTDTLRLTKVRRVTDSILVRDSIFGRDTVRAIVGRERQACDAVIHTCEQQKAGLERENANLEARLKLEKKKKPSRFGCAAPLAATTQGVGLGVACGIRFP